METKRWMIKVVPNRYSSWGSPPRPRPRYTHISWILIQQLTCASSAHKYALWTNTAGSSMRFPGEWAERGRVSEQALTGFLGSNSGGEFLMNKILYLITQVTNLSTSPASWLISDVWASASAHPLSPMPFPSSQVWLLEVHSFNWPCEALGLSSGKWPFGDSDLSPCLKPKPLSFPQTRISVSLCQSDCLNPKDALEGKLLINSH